MDLLRKTKLRERLHDAHEAMAAVFPLSAQLWSDWVNDEIERLAEPEDVDNIAQLFTRAVRDYLSVGLWVSYLE